MADTHRSIPAVMTDAQFLSEYCRHARAGWNAGRTLVTARWRFAVWLRPHVVHGGDRRSADYQEHTRMCLITPSGFNPYHLLPRIKAMAEARNPQCLRWRTSLSYLPLAIFSESEIKKFTSVRSALEAAKEKRLMKMTDNERAEHERVAELKKRAREACPHCESVRSELTVERAARHAAENRAAQLQLQLSGRPLTTTTGDNVRSWR